MAVKKKQKPTVQAPFVWEGVEMWTLPDILETIQLILDEDDAADFMEAYTAVCDDEDHAAHSIGYMIGLVEDEEEREAISDLFSIDVMVEPVQVFRRDARPLTRVGVRKVEA